jgi:hypothetical protein
MMHWQQAREGAGRPAWPLRCLAHSRGCPVALVRVRVRKGGREGGGAVGGTCTVPRGQAPRRAGDSAAPRPPRAPAPAHIELRVRQGNPISASRPATPLLSGPHAQPAILLGSVRSPSSATPARSQHPHIVAAAMLGLPAELEREVIARLSWAALKSLALACTAARASCFERVGALRWDHDEDALPGVDLSAAFPSATRLSLGGGGASGPSPPRPSWTPTTPSSPSWSTSMWRTI